MSSRSIGAEPITSMASSTSSSATRAMSPMMQPAAPSPTWLAPPPDRAGTPRPAPPSSTRHIQQRAVARGRVVPPPAHALEDGVAVQPLGQEAGEPAVAAEERGAGIAGAGPALVPVRIADDADAVVLLERIAHDPLERAPGRVHLDRRLHRVVGELDVGIAPADVRHHHAVLALELLEQLVRGVRVGASRRRCRSHRRSARARSGGWSRPRAGSARCGRRRPPCWPTTRSPGCTRSGRACRTRADSAFSSRQNAPVIWKSLPWWPMTSRKALSRPNSK